MKSFIALLFFIFFSLAGFYSGNQLFCTNCADLISFDSGIIKAAPNGPTPAENNKTPMPISNIFLMEEEEKSHDSFFISSISFMLQPQFHDPLIHPWPTQFYTPNIFHNLLKKPPQA